MRAGPPSRKALGALQLLVDLALQLGVSEFERLAARAAERARLEQEEPLHYPELQPR